MLSRLHPPPPTPTVSLRALALEWEGRKRGERVLPRSMLGYVWVSSTACSMFQSVKYPKQYSPGLEVNSVQKAAVSPSKEAESFWLVPAHGDGPGSGQMCSESCTSCGCGGEHRERGEQRAAHSCQEWCWQLGPRAR